MTCGAWPRSSTATARNGAGSPPPTPIVLTGGPDRLQVGWTLIIPDVDAAPARTPGEQRVTVRRGDTLSAIAERELGSADRWSEIYRANRAQLSDPDELTPGQQLTLPKSAAAEPERSKRGADPVALDPGERPVERGPGPRARAASDHSHAHRPGPPPRRSRPSRRSTHHRARRRTTHRPWTSRCPSPRSADCSRPDWCRGWPGVAGCNCRLDRSAAGCSSRPPPPSRSPWPWVTASGRSACAASTGPCGPSPPIAGPRRPRRHRSNWPSWPTTRSNW